MTQDQVFTVSSPTNEPPHDFTDIPFISVEEVVKSLTEIEFDESKMDCYSPVHSDLMKDDSNQLQDNLSQVQTVDQSVEINQLSGLIWFSILILRNFN